MTDQKTKEAPKVFVVDANGTPLLPTHPARSRRLLREGRARVIRVVPFTIQLNRVVENPVGSFVIGIDDGAKIVGVAVINEVTKEVVFSAELKLRLDVHRKMLQRSQYRRTRRSRKLRHRKPRFLNRGKKGWVSPTIKQKKDSILRVVEDLRKMINIEKVIIEQGQFDLSSIVAGRQLSGVQYQVSDYEGKNFRAKVLWRDRYKCQHCNNVDDLRAHHILSKSQGGTDTPRNGITLCEDCHDKLHRGEWQLDKKPKQFKYPMYLMQGKSYIYDSLTSLGLEVWKCYGFMTSYWRKKIGLEKSHFNDAISMVSRNYLPKIRALGFVIKPRRAKVWESNPTKVCAEKHGFRHYDVIKARHRTRGVVVGSVRSLKRDGMTLRASFDDNFVVSYRKSVLLQRFRGLIYCYG